MGRDSRMLALQCIASHRRSLRSFDIRTAFLRGSRQDSRIPSVEPPSELRLKMALKDEACELLKGAFGLFNAPLLWYLAPGLVISPWVRACLLCRRRHLRSRANPKFTASLVFIWMMGLRGGGLCLFASHTVFGEMLSIWQSASGCIYKSSQVPS